MRRNSRIISITRDTFPGAIASQTATRKYWALKQGRREPAPLHYFLAHGNQCGQCANLHTTTALGDIALFDTRQEALATAKLWNAWVRESYDDDVVKKYMCCDFVHPVRVTTKETILVEEA